MKIEKGTAKNKKYKAIFSHYVDGKLKTIKVTQFGDDRFSDYTMHKDKVRREAYRKRHQKDLQKGNYMSAGWLAMGLLWAASTNLDKNIKAYKRKYNLK